MNAGKMCHDIFLDTFYPAVRTGSSNTRFFTPPSGRGLVIPIFTPPSGRGLVIPVFFSWWSLARLGQTNSRRVFRYTGEGLYLE